MVYRYTNGGSSRKILAGNDTDVSDAIITKFGDDIFLYVSIMLDEEAEKIWPTNHILTRAQFKEHFELQYGSPMMYMSEEDYNWMLE